MNNINDIRKAVRDVVDSRYGGAIQRLSIASGVKYNSLHSFLAGKGLSTGNLCKLLTETGGHVEIPQGKVPA